MNWPQITMIVLAAMSVGIHLANHGKYRTDKYNAISITLTIALEFWLMYEGGFFGAH